MRMVKRVCMHYRLLFRHLLGNFDFVFGNLLLYVLFRESSPCPVFFLSQFAMSHMACDSFIGRAFKVR